MSCSSVANIRIEPVDVTWEGPEIDCFDFTNVDTTAINSSFIQFDGFYAWFDVNSTGVDPNGTGTDIEIDLDATPTEAEIAQAFALAMDGSSDFSATIDGLVVRVTRATSEAVDDTDASDVVGVLHTTVQKGKSVYLGVLQGDVSVAFEETTLELTGHQTGTTLLADLRQGVSATVDLVLQESDNAKRDTLFSGTAGGGFTPNAGTKVYGWGNLKQGLSTITEAVKLVMHPVALPESNRSRDLCFWKSYPLISSLVFSGENPETMSISFKAYIDDSRPKGVNLFAFGDHTQAGITVYTAPTPPAPPPGPPPGP